MQVKKSFIYNLLHYAQITSILLIFWFCYHFLFTSKNYLNDNSSSHKLCQSDVLLSPASVGVGFFLAALLIAIIFIFLIYRITLREK